MTKPQQEIIRLGYQALVDALGIVDAIRFIQYFNLGTGDYTTERHQWLDQKPLNEILTSIKQQQENDSNQYDEIIN
ncbi:MAG: hypothetical protein AAFO04_28235 [Cyanobacteria bacterium J06592_8]